MKCILNVIKDYLSIEIEAESQKELFEGIAGLQGVFNNNQCSVCGTERPNFIVRKASSDKGRTFNYYELQCRNNECRAKLHFGVHEEGETLFPKRKNEDGTYHAKQGWKIWDGKKEV